MANQLSGGDVLGVVVLCLVLGYCAFHEDPKPATQNDVDAAQAEAETRIDDLEGRLNRAESDISDLKTKTNTP